MKSRLTLAAGLCTALTVSTQAEVKINDNISLDGYVIGAGVVTEGTPAKNGPEFGKSGGAFDSAYFAVNGNYGDFSGKFSLYSVNFGDNNTSDDVGVLDAYATYKIGALSLTGGKYLGWLGYESFHSPNNAFISFSQVAYASPFSTGVKADYAGEGFSGGVSVRDSQFEAGSFQEGDGDFGDDLGFEAYVMLTSIDKLTVFAGFGFQDVDGGETLLTTDLWASYAVTDKFSLAGEIGTQENKSDFSWLLQGTYAATEALSVSARLSGFDGTGDLADPTDPTSGYSDAIAYGIASTYTITENFSVKGEITKTDSSGGSDTFGYALQGLFRF